MVDDQDNLIPLQDRHRPHKGKLGLIKAFRQKSWSRGLRTKKGERVLFYMVIAVGITTLAFKLATLGLHIALYSTSVFSDSIPLTTPRAWYGLTGVSIGIVLVNSLFSVWKHARLRKFIKQSESASLEKGLPVDAKILPPKATLFQNIGILSCTVLNLFMLVTTIALLVDSSSRMLENDYTAVSLALEVLESFAAGLSAIFTILDIMYLCWTVFMFSQSILLVVSILNFVIAVLTVFINDLTRALVNYNNDENPYSIFDDDNGTSFNVNVHAFSHYRVYPMFALVEGAVGLMGVGICLVVGASNRLTVTLADLMRFFVLCSIVSSILNVVWFAMSCANTGLQTNNPYMHEAIIANPVLSSVGFCLLIIGILTCAHLQAQPPNKLRVQPYRLDSLTPQKLRAWEALIDQYSRSIPGAASGKQALDLMQAYVKSPMDGMDCVVLRVYDEEVRDREQEKSYEKVRAWQQLDTQSLFEDNDGVADVLTLVPSDGSPAAGEKKMSKNAAKRAAHKAAKKQAKGNKRDSINYPITAAQNTNELQADLEFRAELMATEALVMLTQIHEYDLTAPINGRMGKWLLKTLGVESWSKLLVVRMGLLATHWPFRQAIFYTAPTKRPNARSAAVLQAIAEWNIKRPRAERCTMLLDPVPAYNGSEQSIQPSGWLPTYVPPSHVVDLRKFKGKQLTDYLKAIKYRNQAVAFNKANGEVVETSDFSYENCSIVMNLWHKIAEKRTSEGYTAVLKDPNVDFLMSLGDSENNRNSYRKLLFLKVDGEVIASAVLFFLGDTITSDIQGLDHEKARQFKAYFVMMQETIAIALRDNISFVDFGPTTGKAKMDIGSREIPLKGAIYAQQPLSTMVQLFADQVHSG
ncbi:hypothetical protein B9G98_04159 [Wickerhamiella sorbophila]|uniref:BioF2-like acetyltransferase domain-containing protein n=1 Tax=Wickerhamiella sorbophila TaxID=45607 RepID=A0A2T0FNJ9_9ASCO|nr:hypothetical protein B9G98_04159 [Wickerhamiella sorbophila]PRT56539.1 hypothetical protein B9G98_04159 [Wickerhamiella sorbophila]